MNVIELRDKCSRNQVLIQEVLSFILKVIEMSNKFPTGQWLVNVFFFFASLPESFSTIQTYSGVWGRYCLLDGFALAQSCHDGYIVTCAVYDEGMACDT